MFKYKKERNPINEFIKNKSMQACACARSLKRNILKIGRNQTNLLLLMMFASLSSMKWNKQPSSCKIQPKRNSRHQKIKRINSLQKDEETVREVAP